MYVYISENENFVEFQDAQSLFWKQREITYGDWSTGPLQDGSFTKHSQIQATQVHQQL